MKEALRRALVDDMHDFMGTVSESPGVHRAQRLIARAIAALSEGQAPEPVAQEPDAWSVEGGRLGPVVRELFNDRAAAMDCANHYDAHISPLYTHPAGMDAARAKAIEEAETWKARAMFLLRHSDNGMSNCYSLNEVDAAIRDLATKGAGS